MKKYKDYTHDDIKGYWGLAGMNCLVLLDFVHDIDEYAITAIVHDGKLTKIRKTRVHDGTWNNLGSYVNRLGRDYPLSDCLRCIPTGYVNQMEGEL